MSYAGCPGPSPAISAQFILKMCVPAKNRKKLLKKPCFESSRSFKVIDVDTNKKLVTIACVEMCAASKIAKNLLKTPFWGFNFVQGHLCSQI